MSQPNNEEMEIAKVFYDQLRLKAKVAADKYFALMTDGRREVAMDHTLSQIVKTSYAHGYMEACMRFVEETAAKKASEPSSSEPEGNR
jgi:hypothetical protein